MMKKFYLLIFLPLLLTLRVSAQTTITKTRHLDEQTVVKDSSGMIYPYAIWRKLISTGNYNLKPVDPRSDTTAYILVKMSDAEKTKWAAHLPKPPESKFFTTGQKIDLFNTKDMNGFKLKLREMPGKVIVLNFWFIGCPPCRQEIPELNKLAQKYASNPDVIFVAICLDQGYQVDDFLKTTPFSYHVVGEGQYYADKYKINLYPTNVVIDKNGAVQFHSSGYSLSTPLWIGKTIDAALGTPGPGSK